MWFYKVLVQGPSLLPIDVILQGPSLHPIGVILQGPSLPNLCDSTRP